MDRLFYELMQVAMGQIDCLERGPSPEEWQDLHTLAQGEDVVGACYQSSVHLFDFGLRAPQDLILDWMNEAEELREQCELTEQRYQTLLKKMNERSLRFTMIAGQGMTYYYNDELHDLRKPDGIDFFIYGGKEHAEKFVKLTGQQEVRDDGSIVYLDTWADTEVRLHYRLKAGKASGRNKSFDRWLRQNNDALFRHDGELTIPSPSMSAVLTMLSLYNQFLSKSLTMRSLMDYYFILRKSDGQFESFKGGQSFDALMKSLHLSRFSRGMMWVMQEIMGLERKYMPSEPMEDEGRFLIGEISCENGPFTRWKHLLAHYRWSEL